MIVPKCDSYILSFLVLYIVYHNNLTILIGCLVPQKLSNLLFGLVIAVVEFNVASI